MNPNRTRGTTVLRLCLVAAALLAAVAAKAATINNLFNTGVNNGGNALPANVNDPHYNLIFPTFNTEVTVTDGVFPIPPWVANNAGSRWIGPTSNGTAAAGNYTYRTTFSLPLNAILNSVNISGLWSTDDAAIDIFINGNATGSTTFGHAGLWPFNISGGGLFQFGPNTLDFALNNSPLAGSFNPTGLRVDRIQGTFLIVPEPAAAFLAAAAIVMSVGPIRRRRNTSVRQVAAH